MTWVMPVTMEGRWLRLEPLQESHAEALAAVTPPETFRYFTVHPSGSGAEAMRAMIRGFAGDSTRLHWAMVLRESGAVVGSTAYLDIRPAHRGLEVGFTWITPEHRGTRVNPESKRLMLGHAFETLGAERVQLKCDARNARSRAAILKLGATFEGVLRRHIIMPDGYVRDTAMYSVVRGEWEGVRAGLRQRLGLDG